MVVVLVVIGFGILRAVAKSAKSSNHARSRAKGFASFGPMAAGGIMTGWLLDKILMNNTLEDEAAASLRMMNFYQLQQFALENDLLTQIQMDDFMQQIQQQQMIDQQTMDQQIMDQQMMDQHMADTVPGHGNQLIDEMNGIDHGMGIADSHDTFNDFGGGGGGGFDGF